MKRIVCKVLHSRNRTMAGAFPSNQDLFTCPICLDLLKVPVTLHCGHSYCMDCIKDCWDQEDQKRVYSCPQCRQTFTPRPVLNKNNIFAELVEQIRKTGVQPVAPASAEPECDVCTGRKLKAVKSCLECLVYYCETHYKAYNELYPGRKHKVVDAIGQLQERICSQHEKPLEVFCRTDQSCVCLLCLADEHKGHDTVSTSVGRSEKQLGETKRRSQQRIQEREKELQELRKAVGMLKSSAQTAVEDSEMIFTEMIRTIERRCSEVKEQIRAQEKAEVSRAEEHLKRLEQEIAELKWRDPDLKQLSLTDDHIHFLKTFQSVSELPKSKDLPCISVNKSLSFEAVRRSVSTLQRQLEDFCNLEAMTISAAVTEVQAILPSEPTTRQEFLQYSCHFTLDSNTAHRQLHLSEGNRRVEYRIELQSYPDHPDRFDEWWQVLCREGVSGCCYWEIEWSGLVYIAVSYKNISRKGGNDNSFFGSNDQSWRLRLSSSSYSFCHKNKEIDLSLVASSNRIGVYLDYRAGILALYSISDTMTLLHRVQTTFTHTLYPGFWLDVESSVKLV
ncbi:tripartite motif-containing protein 16-like isoform X2 [Alosa pseudoharengus]|uniref:tripartite motif-containing protein 16-like isoform X2 n=1 Tax=Alosa pseudoharengus TaxID=34774 RepID=UPI003F8C518E